MITDTTFFTCDQAAIKLISYMVAKKNLHLKIDMWVKISYIIANNINKYIRLSYSGRAP